MDTTTKQLWLKYTELLKNKIPDLYKNLNPPIQQKELDEILAIYKSNNLEIPKDLIEIFKINNGEKGGEVSQCIGFFLQGLYKNSIPTYLFEDMEDRYNEIFSLPKGWVKTKYHCRKWFPFCSDGIGGSLCVDLDPDTNGKSGQIISFNRDDYGRVVFANSIPDFLKALIRKLENDDFTYTEYEANNKLYKHFFLTKQNFDYKDWGKGGLIVAMTWRSK
jgi:internalin A